MAHKKGLGSSKNGRDSAAKRFYPGAGAGLGGDDTLFATMSGTVEFSRRRGRRYVSVVDADAAATS